MIPGVLFWISFAVTIAAVWVAVGVVKLSRDGVLGTMTWWLLAGVIFFGVHHAIELLSEGETGHVVSETFEKLTPLTFLVGALLLARTLRSLMTNTTDSE